MNKFFDLIRENERLKDFFGENRTMIIKVAAAALLVVAAFLIFSFTARTENSSIDREAIEVESQETVGTEIYVDIGGEVAEPMVVKLEEGCRVEDAINAAGGITANADLTEINRAAFLEDGEKVFIPSKILTEAATDGYTEIIAPSYSDGKININTAGSEDLQRLNGVGPATAEKILDYRSENGRFKTIEDIKNVSGIGDKTFEKFKDDIKV